MRMRTFILVSFPLACQLPAAQHTAAPIDPNPLKFWAGCYKLRLSSWSPKPSEFEVPAVLRLDPTLGSLGRHPATPIKSSSGRQFQGFWRPFDAESVRVSWTNGFWGLDMVLKIDGDSVLGRVSEWRDFIRGPDFPPSASLSARRAIC